MTVSELRDMSDLNNDMIFEEISDELMHMTLGQFFTALEERGIMDDFSDLGRIYSEFVERIYEERAERYEYERMVEM